MRKRKNTLKISSNKSNKALISVPWLWLLFGVTIGILISSFIFDNEKSTKVAKKAKDLNENLLSIKTKKNYDFYNLLTKNEETKFKNKENTNNEPSKSKTLALKSTKSSPSTYVIQAGSFQRKQDAQKLKAKLALLGFISNIKTVKVKDKTWYRIQLGPYSNKSKAKQSQAKLKLHSITSSMLVKAKN